MNSSTSSSSFRRFGLGFLLLAFAPGLGLFLLGIWLEPLEGDLTRIGGFSERDYGWRTPQQAFTHPLPADEGQYRYRDVLVLGDSFATAWPRLQWQNHLQHRTGASVGTLNINRISIDQLLNDPAFKAHPPKVLILESAERYLTLRLGTESAAREPRSHEKTRPQKHEPLSTASPGPGQEPLYRSQALAAVQIPFAARYLLRSVQREVLGQTPGNAVRVKLDQHGLFSNRRSAELLVFREDFQKEPLWRNLGLPEITRRLQSLRTRVEANGVTRLVVLIAPDKLTAYQEVIAEPSFAPYSALASLIEQCRDFMPDSVGTLQKAIREGTEDLYLPDDTHWGSSGQERIAELLLTFLNSRAPALF